MVDNLAATLRLLAGHLDASLHRQLTVPDAGRWRLVRHLMADRWRVGLVFECRVGVGGCRDGHWLASAVVGPRLLVDVIIVVAVLVLFGILLFLNDAKLLAHPPVSRQTS